VLVSCGLLAEIIVNDKYGPGDLVPSAGDVKVAVRVLGPSWVKADRVELYASGVKIREAPIAGGGKAGVQGSGEWSAPRVRPRRPPGRGGRRAGGDRAVLARRAAVSADLPGGAAAGDRRDRGRLDRRRRRRQEDQRLRLRPAGGRWRMAERAEGDRGAARVRR